MAFDIKDVDALLARSGRMCAICNLLHGVQVHHITPRSEGGSDDISNAIPLCPNCHSEVHSRYSPGRTTRAYTASELRGHLARTIALASRQGHLTAGNDDWNHDAELIEFYARCLDRPAFRTPFHQELSFADLDQALEDTVLAINTGLWRTRDGTLIARSSGRRALVNPSWRTSMADVVTAVTQARHELRTALGLDQMLMNLHRRPHPYDRHAPQLRSSTQLTAAMNDLRSQVIDTMNAVLAQAGLPTLDSTDGWT